MVGPMHFQVSCIQLFFHVFLAHSGIYATYPFLSTFYPRMIFYPLGNAKKILINMAISILRFCIY